MNRKGRLKTYLLPHQQALYWKQWVTTRYTPIFWRNKPIRQRQMYAQLLEYELDGIVAALPGGRYQRVKA